MRRPAVRSAVAVLTTLSLIAASPVSADAQGWGDRLKKKAEEVAKRKAEERTEKRAGEAADKALDKVECAASDRACQEKAAAQTGKSVTSGGSVAGAGARVGEGAWANYDFKPGDRPLFVDDFTRDEVGDFPRRLELAAGNMEIVEWQGRRLLRGTSNPSSFEIPLSATLPERFTIELDIKLGLSSNQNAIYFGPKDQSSILHASLLGWWNSPTSGTLTAGLVDHRGAGKYTVELEGVPEMLPVRLMVDGRYAKMYVGSTRVANVPNADLGRAKAVHFELRCSADYPCFVGNIRLMAGGKKLYDALSESGRVSTQGIYFDTGSDRIRPESTPTLKEIGQMLTENPDLKITIEGHTDNAGDARVNEELSQRRAAAVKAYLVEKHSIDASRLGSSGLGAKKPVAKNDSPEGRQQNRRVELVKM